MSEQLLRKMLQLIDEKLQDVEMVLAYRDKKNAALLMEKVELLRARKEIERDLHGERQIDPAQKVLYPTIRG